MSMALVINPAVAKVRHFFMMTFLRCYLYLTPIWKYGLQPSCNDCNNLYRQRCDREVLYIKKGYSA